MGRDGEEQRMGRMARGRGGEGEGGSWEGRGCMHDVAALTQSRLHSLYVIVPDKSGF